MVRRGLSATPAPGRNGLGLRIAAGAALALTILTAFAASALHANLETGRDQARANQLRSARAAAALVAAQVAAVQQELRGVGSSPAFTGGDVEAVRSTLDSVDAAALGFVDGLVWVARDGAGEVSGVGEGSAWLDLSDRAVVAEALGGVAVAEALGATSTGRFPLLVAVPTIGGDGRPDGALAGRVELDIDRSNLLARLFGTQEVAIYDRAGHLAFGRDVGRLGSAMPDALRAAIRHHDDGVVVGVTGPSGGSDRVLAFSGVSTAGWTVVVEVPRRDVDRAAVDQYRRSLIALGTLAAAMLVAAAIAAINIDRAHRRVIAGQSQLSAVIDELPAGVVVTDGEDRLVTVNTRGRAALSLLGVDAADLPIGARLPSVVAGEMVAATERDPQAGPIEFADGDADGGRWFALRARKVRANPRARGGLVALFTDTTTMRLAERHRSAMAALVASLAAADSTEQIVQQVLQRAHDAVGSHRAAVLLFDPASGILDIEAADHDPHWRALLGTTLDGERAPVVAAVREGKAVELADDMGRPWRVNVVPLPSAGRVVGAVALAFELEAEQSSVDLGGFAAQIAVALDRARRREIEHDVSLTLQRTLLAVPPTHLAELSIATRYRPAGEQLLVGGDFFDVIDLGGSDRLVVIGDVVGHGLAAAATMGQVKVAIQAFALEDPSPASVLGRLDDFVATQLPAARYTTAVLVHVSVPQARLRYAIAGHPPPLVRLPDGTVTALDSAREPLLGLPPNGGRTESTVELGRGITAVCLYTDGLIEQPRVPIDDGISAVAKVLAGRDDRDASAVESSADAVMDLVRGRPRRDDTAVVYLAVRI